jgi:hypothetical protein
MTSNVFRTTLGLRAPFVALTASGPAGGPGFVADAIANIVARRRAIVEPARLVIARTAGRATLVAPGSAILPTAGLTLARGPVFERDRIAEAVGLDPRLGAVRISWTTRIAAGATVTLTLAASAGARRTKTAWPCATGTAARRAAGRSATLVAARRTAVEWCLLAGKPGRLVDANLLLRRAAA